MPDPVDSLMSPVVQYGFAGFCVILLALLVWIVRVGVKMVHEVTRVVDNNTATIDKVNATVERHENNAFQRAKETLDAVHDLREKLLARPCLVKHK